VDRLLGLVEHVSPTPRTISDLPFYYRQLFLEHTVATRDFWMPRPRVEARVETALARFRRGYEGGVLIVGDPGSGKSSLVARIAQRTTDAAVLRVAPPPHATADPSVFTDHLRGALGGSADAEATLGRLPFGTVVLIDDLDLWWERRAGGLEVVQHILDLIDRFGGRCLFVVTATTDAVMQIFEKLIKSLLEHEITHFKSWLYVTSRNHVLMQLRKKKDIPLEEIPQSFMESDVEMHPEDALESNLSKLEQCIEKLVKEQKACVTLFYLQHKCYQEINEQTGYDLKKVKSYIQNGKRNLKICLESNG
jgi:RNA polymerase sigma-70 factor (ECF subfamily)